MDVVKSFNPIISFLSSLALVTFRDLPGIPSNLFVFHLLTLLIQFNQAFWNITQHMIGKKKTIWTMLVFREQELIIPAGMRPVNNLGGIAFGPACLHSGRDTS